MLVTLLSGKIHLYPQIQCHPLLDMSQTTADLVTHINEKIISYTVQKENSQSKNLPKGPIGDQISKRQ